jgi:hypothetical protein
MDRPVIEDVVTFTVLIAVFAGRDNMQELVLIAGGQLEANSVSKGLPRTVSMRNEDSERDETRSEGQGLFKPTFTRD